AAASAPSCACSRSSRSRAGIAAPRDCPSHREEERTARTITFEEQWTLREDESRDKSRRGMTPASGRIHTGRRGPRAGGALACDTANARALSRKVSRTLEGMRQWFLGSYPGSTIWIDRGGGS